ncbi:MAG: DUF3899 domain-containing protein [Clostridia bacterium]|nr:DUF3899 domain-containing protein [Clostridia bacterium]
MSKKAKLIAGIISFVVGAIIAVGIFVWRYNYYAEAFALLNLTLAKQDIYKLISDGCFASGAVLLSISLLGTVSNLGAFNGIQYLGTVLRTKFSRSATKRTVMSYYDFVQKKNAKAKLSFNFMFFPGAFYLGLAVLFTILFSY